MKPFSFFLLTLATNAFAQSSPPTTTPEKVPPLVIQEHAAAPAVQLSRVDLDFKGGPPAALVDAISKSLGKQVNVIIDEGDAQVHLPPIRVRNATAPDIFSALANATTREVLVPAGRDSYQTRQVRSQFMPNSNLGGITDETVWSFVSNEPETKQAQLNFAKTPKPALRHFQLGSYLSDKLSVEDITTAIRTGWELLGVKEQPELKFHKETGILIAAGDAELLEQIPLVLQQLPTSAQVGSFALPPPPSIPRVSQPRPLQVAPVPATQPTPVK
jgi:hypothetical protein